VLRVVNLLAKIPTGFYNIFKAFSFQEAGPVSHITGVVPIQYPWTMEI